MSITLDELRSHFPALDRWRLFNFASTGVLPAPAAEAMAQFARQATEPLGEHFSDWLETLETARGRVAELINAPAEQIAFVPNTSTALSVVAAAVRWQPGDRVLFPANEYPANRYAWENLREHGVECRPVQVRDDQTFLEAISEQDWERVRLIALSAVSYHDGRVHDIAEVVRVSHARGAYVSVDAIQAAGAVPIDASAWGCDFLSCGGQKWLLGPLGTGFCSIAAGVIDELWTPLVGWESTGGTGDYSSPLRFRPGTRRLEPAMPDIGAIAALSKSLELLGSAGWPAVFERIATAQQTVRDMARDSGFATDEPASAGPSGILSVQLPTGVSEDHATAILKKHRVVATVRSGRLRFSAHAITRDDDLDVLPAVFQELGSP